jgi:DNA-binding NtrC family response regulator
MTPAAPTPRSRTPLRRVLIVDDDEAIAGAVYDYLVACGFDVDLATSAETAEEKLRTGRYEIVLMDAYLTGYLNRRALDLVDRIRLLTPGAYVIVLTAYASPRLTQHLARHDRLTLVSKPKSASCIGELIEGLMPSLHDERNHS